MRSTNTEWRDYFATNAPALVALVAAALMAAGLWLPWAWASGYGVGGHLTDMDLSTGTHANFIAYIAVGAIVLAVIGLREEQSWVVVALVLCGAYASYLVVQDVQMFVALFGVSYRPGGGSGLGIGAYMSVVGAATLFGSSLWMGYRFNRSR